MDLEERSLARMIGFVRSFGTLSLMADAARDPKNATLLYELVR